MAKINVTQKIEITALTSGNINVNIDSNVDQIYLYATSTFPIVNNVTITFTGDIIEDATTIRVLCNLPITASTGSVTINGLVLNSKFYNTKSIIDFTNFSGSWVATIMTSLTESSLIESSQLSTDSVVTAKIRNSNVTADKLGSNSVTNVKIADGSVTLPKLSTDAKTYTITIPISFETGEQSDQEVSLYATTSGKVLEAWYAVTKSIAATDNAIFDFRLNGSPLFSVNPSLPASTPNGADGVFTPDINVSMLDGYNKININGTKVTAGGKVLLSLIVCI